MDVTLGLLPHISAAFAMRRSIGSRKRRPSLDGVAGSKLLQVAHNLVGHDTRICATPSAAKYDESIRLLKKAGAGHLAGRSYQRETYQLQEDVTALRSALGRVEESGTSRCWTQQTFDSASKVNANVVSMNTGITRALQAEVTRVTELSDSVTGLSVKVVNASINDIADLRDTVESLLVTANKQQQTLSDLINLAKLNRRLRVPRTPTSGFRVVFQWLRRFDNLLARSCSPWGSAIRMAVSPELALTEFIEFLRLYPNDPRANRAQYQIADIHYDQQKLAEAVAEYEAAIHLSPTDAAVVPDASSQERHGPSERKRSGTM